MRINDGRRAEALVDRWGDRVLVMPDGCWEWQGIKNAYGYGVITTGSTSYGTVRRFMAHRLAWEFLRGPIPDGLQMDHLCRNRGCVNPDHLEPVTQHENLLRGNTIPARNAAKTHCAKGHAYDEANTRRDKKTGARICRACRADQQRRRRAERTA